jgi:hypothetical protein
MVACSLVYRSVNKNYLFASLSAASFATPRSAFDTDCTKGFARKLQASSYISLFLLVSKVKSEWVACAAGSLSRL